MAFPPLTPDDAAKILRAHFGMQLEDPSNPNSASYGDPTGAVALGVNRGVQSRELENRIRNEEAATAAMGPSIGYVPGEPGRRYLNTMPMSNLFEDRDRLEQLRRDEAADPFTGAAETARIGGIQKALDTAATTMRPEVDAAARTTADRNAFAEFLKARGVKLGELEAQASPTAYAAGMTPVRVAGSAENQANLNAAAGRTIAQEIAKNQGKPEKYTAQENVLLDSANTVELLGPQLLRMLEQHNPGIAQDPTQYGSWTDMAVGKGGGVLYRMGKLGTVDRDRINQLTGYLEVQIPQMLKSGRLTQTQYDDLKMHAPQLGYSDGENYARTQYILDNILPAVRKGIDATHGANPTAAHTPQADYSPPTADELALAASRNPGATSNDLADQIIRQRNAPYGPFVSQR